MYSVFYLCLSEFKVRVLFLSELNGDLYRLNFQLGLKLQGENKLQ